MAGINDAFLNSYRQKAINQLVPGRSIGNRFLENLNKSYDDKTDMFSGLGFRRFDLGKGETPISAAGLGLAEGALNIPASLADVYKSIISPIDAGVSTITEAAFDPKLTETGRKKIAERIARDTSGMELGLPIDTSVPKGKIGSGLATGYTDPDGKKQTTESTFGQSLETRDEVAKRLAELSNKADKANIGVDSFGADKSGDQVVSGEEEKADPKGEFSDPEAQAALAEMQQKITENTQLGDMSQEGAEMEVITPEMREPVLSEEEKLAQAQQSLFKSAMEDFNSIYGDDKKPSGAKTIEQYKEDFAKATGIDVSGEPDNKLALMSLGLSLMQNRAGKGFNLSNIIGAAGEAGQKAMPLFEKAKAEARAGQVAAGKFALQETKADTVAKAAFLKEKRTALNALGKETRDQQGKYIIQAMKDKNDLDVAMINARAKAIKDGKLNLKKSISQQVQGLKGVEVQFGFDQSGNEKILNPTSSARGLADGYGNLLQANDSIDYLLNVNKEIAQAGSPAAYLLTERAKGLLTTLGVRGEELFKDQTYVDANNNKVVIKGISREAGAEAVQDRLLAQFKRFLSQETGNGISNVDFKNLEKQVGRINLATNPNDRIMRLNELKKMFAVPMNRVKSLFDQLNDRRFHTNDDNYTRTQEILLDVLKKSTPKQYQNRISIDESGGIQIIDVTG